MKSVQSNTELSSDSKKFIIEIDWNVKFWCGRGLGRHGTMERFNSKPEGWEGGGVATFEVIMYSLFMVHH